MITPQREDVDELKRELCRGSHLEDDFFASDLNCRLIVFDNLKPLRVGLKELSGVVVRLYRRYGFWRKEVLDHVRNLLAHGPELKTRSVPEISSRGKHVRSVAQLVGDDAEFAWRGSHFSCVMRHKKRRYCYVAVRDASRGSRGAILIFCSGRSDHKSKKERQYNDLQDPRV